MDCENLQPLAEKYYEDNKRRFHCGGFTDKMIVASGFYAGYSLAKEQLEKELAEAKANCAAVWEKIGEEHKNGESFLVGHPGA